MKTQTVFSLAEKATASGQSLQLDVYDIIGDFWKGGDGNTTARSVAAALRDNRTASEIKVRINSYGGILDEAQTIRAVLVDHPAAVTIDIDGIAASAATVILAAGNKIRIGSPCAIMIHEARSGMRNATEADYLARAAELKIHNDGLAQLYANVSAKRGKNVSVEQFRAWMSQEKWFSAQDAVDAGLADEVVDAIPDALIAQLDLSECRAVPGWVTARFATSNRTDAGATPVTTQGQTKQTIQPEPTASGSLNIQPPAVPVETGKTHIMPQLAVILAALGLTEGTSDADVLSAITSLKASASSGDKLIAVLGAKTADEAIGTVAALQANREQTDPEGHAKVMAALGAKTADEAVGKIEALKSTQEQLALAQSKIDAFGKQDEQREREQIIAQLRADGKCTPAQENTLFPTFSLASLKSFAATATPVLKGDGNRPPRGGATSASKWEDMSPEEQRQLHDSDPEAFAASFNEYDSRVKNA